MCHANSFEHRAVSHCARLLVFVLGFSLIFSGCGGKEYLDGDIRQLDAVAYGQVLDVSDVVVEEDPSLVGPLVGLGAGGLLGSMFGAGTGRTLFVLGGAAIGSEIGGGLDKRKRRYRAMQLTLQLDNGKILMVVQGFDEYFMKGDRIRVVVMDEGRARVQLA